MICDVSAIPPPELPGSGSRVESRKLSSQPGITRLPVQVMLSGAFNCTAQLTDLSSLHFLA